MIPLLVAPAFRAELKTALEHDDARAAWKLVDRARLAGADYAQLCQVAFELTGIAGAAWDALMQEADELSDHEAERDDDRGGCPGCGGSCQTACR